MWWARLLNQIAAIHGTGTPAVTNSYESIATVLVGSGGSSTITFSSIPSTYKHLQIRAFYQNNQNNSSVDYMQLRFNSDTGNNYVTHRLRGNGSAASASTTAATNYAYTTLSVQGVANIFGGAIIDILDYTNTNKNKVVRTLAGYDGNGAGDIGLNSNLWLSTSSITQIELSTQTGNINQYSSFALYGIKG
jgi:hypothetical protein